MIKYLPLLFLLGCGTPSNQWVYPRNVICDNRNEYSCIINGNVNHFEFICHIEPSKNSQSYLNSTCRLPVAAEEQFPYFYKGSWKFLLANKELPPPTKGFSNPYRLEGLKVQDIIFKW